MISVELGQSDIKASLLEKYDKDRKHEYLYMSEPKSALIRIESHPSNHWFQMPNLFQIVSQVV